MSSRLHRGGVPMSPIAWRSVGSTEDVVLTRAQQPAQEYSPPPPASGGGRGARFGNDPEQKMRAAYQQGVQEGPRAIEEMSGMRQRFRQEAEEDVVKLALGIARRVLHRELTVAPDALLGLVKAALEKIEAREVHTVRIRPEDATMVKQFLGKMGLPQRVEVVADPGLERGAAIFDSSRGTLDASVETQLAEIERGLADLVRRV
jgi:flagellar biosynthesis/type III secretory pathway protein FliH